MDTIYYVSNALLVLAFIGLPIATIYLSVKPHILNKSKYIVKPISRSKIFLIGILAFALSLFSFSSIMAATEPESVRQKREAEQAAVLKAQQDKEAKEESEAEAKKKREEEAKKPVIKTETKTKSIGFESVEEQDANLPQGQTRIAVEGTEGERTITYEVTYVEAKETARKLIKSEITKAPTTKITKVGTYVAPPPQPAPATPAPQSSSNVYYKNCTAARAAGAAPVYAGEPGYASHLDRDNDGIGCE